MGVTTLITVIAVMTGFGSQIRGGFSGFYSHIIVRGQSKTDKGWTPEIVRDYPEVLKKVEAVDGVVAASPFVYTEVAMRVRNLSYNLPLRAVDAELERRTSTIADKMIKGDFSFPVEIISPGDPETGEEPLKMVSILVGRLVANETGITVGDTVELAVATFGAMGRTQRIIKARVNGVFSFGTVDQDTFIYTSLDTGQILQTISPDDCTGISVLTENIEDADAVKQRIVAALGENYLVKTWVEMNPQLFDIVAQERFIMYLIVTLIVAVAALNIISSLSMMVNHKRKEIGIIRSLGAKRRSVTAIFGMMGVFIGAIGTGLGVAGGLAISLNFNGIRAWVSSTFGFNLFSIFTEIPVVVRPVDVITISCISVMLCILASIYPAWKASRLHPVEALRYE